MSLMIDYKEFLTDSPVHGVSCDVISDLVCYDTRFEKEHNIADLRSDWASMQAEVTAIYCNIDTIILALVTGKMSFDDYVDAKMELLVGEKDMAILRDAATAAVEADNRARTDSPIIDPSVAAAGTDSHQYKSVINAEGQIVMRPHISAIMVMLNTIGVNAVNPRSLFTTTIILGGGESIVVHEPTVEVTMKIRATMSALMSAQQKHASRANIMPAMPGMPFMNRGR